MNKLYALPRITLGAIATFLAGNFAAVAGELQPTLPRAKKPAKSWGSMAVDRVEQAAWNARVDAKNLERLARRGYWLA